ncbi:2'-5' RNA ligase family protein [Actinoplanes sp. TRM 88003]|uniref:2'-5' RNA ligase family protein n=1 Tax=Paractinoplanes aksuensis TaxID=2939490 RepID=A0ABT1DEA9_9ACTN|nr:2'-5' RNA ligase family protein [Actinoplanes aksuensis]MCO8269149.1 2'-5' RNA ligase family protein [Actinoplanes aksuensis]
MHTVELLPSAALDSRVRELWALLLQAGLPSLATHAHATNRPHLTLVTAASLADLPHLPLPIVASLTSVRMLGRALVWAVDPSPSLSALHETAWSSVGGWPPPDEFVPHISLALRVPLADQPAALDLLSATPPMSGSFDAARTYDTETRTTRNL